MRKKTPSPGEMEILETMHKTGPATVKQIREALPKRRKPAHTTVITILQRMETKGFVQHKKSGEGKSFVFFLTDSIPTIRRRLVAEFLRKYFGNDPVSLISSVIKVRSLSVEESKNLQDLLSPTKENQRE